MDNPSGAATLFKSLVKTLATKNIVDACFGDIVVQQFSSFAADRKVTEELDRFQKAEEAIQPRLDVMYHDMMASKYSSLWDVVRKILTLSHGNAPVC